MAHLNLYLPEELEKRVKSLSKKSHQSISAYIVDLIKTSLGEGSKSEWSPEFIDLVKSGFNGIEEPNDLPIGEEIEPLDDLSS
jgi:hypothetical protein